MPRSGVSSPLQLHLGCGAVSPSNWVNIDYSWNARLAKVPGLRQTLATVGIVPKALAQVAWSKDVLIHDLTKPLPFADASVDCIYSSHCVEHLTREHARRLLGECRRVMKSQGIIRIVVPDLLWLATTYVQSAGARPAASAEEFLHDLTVFPAAESNPFLRIFRSMHNAYHKWMYDEALLTRELEAAGFQSVRRRQFQDSDIPNIERVEVASHRFEKAFCLEGVAGGPTA